MTADTLRTARLLLRPWRAGDAAPLAAGIGNYEVARWLGRVPYPYGIDDAQRFIAGAEPGMTWAICDDSGLVGGIGRDDDLGYWFDRRVWGRGLATEACDAVSDAVFADPAARTLQSAYFEGNERSARVLIKQGFHHLGVARVTSRALSQDMVSHAMILSRTDWAARRTFRVTTPRLTLRELRDDDLAALHRIGGMVAVARNLTNIPPHWTAGQAERWLIGSKYRGRSGFRAAICRRGALVGVVGIAPSHPTGTQRCMYFIDPDHSGRGYATEALCAFLADVTARFAIRAVAADHFDDNPASGAVLAHAGFRVVGRDAGTSAAREGRHPMTLYRRDAVGPTAP